MGYHIASTAGASRLNLIPPLPEGSHRKRERPELMGVQTGGQSSLPRESSVSLASVRREATVNLPQGISDVYFDNTVTHLDMWSDGACRGNGSRNAKSSIGVYCGDQKCPYNHGEKVDEPTNNRAELRGFIKMIQIAETIKAKHPLIRSFGFHLDSSYVICGCNEGTMDLPFDRGHANSDLWVLAGEQMKKLNDCHVLYHWVPRYKNRCADELANAALDDRLPNIALTNEVEMSQFSRDSLIKALEFVTVHRVRALKYIPRGLEPLFVQVCEAISTRDLPFEERRMLFIIVPHIIAIYTDHINDKQLYKHLRQHLCMLSNEAYFNEHILQLSEQAIRQTARTGDDVMHPGRIMSLCRIGSFHKCLRTDDVVIENDPSAATIETIESQAFKQRPLPPLLKPTQTVVTYGEVFAAFRKLKSHKGATLSGWTKETLYHVVTAVHLKEFLVQVVNAIVNDNLTFAERNLFKTSIAIILRYVAKDKRRLCLCSDTLLKLCWHVVLRGVIAKDQNFAHSANTYSMKGQCQLSVHTVQHVINNGIVPTQMDAISAFPTASRFAAFEYLASRENIYGNAFPLFNMIYGSPSYARLFLHGETRYVFVSTTGGNQGCVSGPLFHAVSTIRTTLKFSKSICQVADDITTIKEEAELETKVIAEFKKVEQDLDGPKKKLLSAQNLPSIVLGAIVAHPTNTHASIKALVLPTIAKAQKNYNAIRDLNAPIQCKMLIMRSHQWNYMYYFETWSPIAGQILAEALETLQYETFMAIFPELQKALAEVGDHERYVLLNDPIEDGGVGLMPFREMQGYFYNRSVTTSRPIILGKFGIDIGEPSVAGQQPLSRSVAGKWHQLFQEHMTASRTRYQTLEGRMFCKASDFKSWIDTWPTNKWTQMDDDAYTLAMTMRFKLMPKMGILCPHKGALDIVLKAHERYDHLVACRTCASYTEKFRHDAVVKMLHRTFNYHTTQSHILRLGEMPVNVEEPHSGSDILVWTNKTYSLDVSISAAQDTGEHHIRRMNHTYQRKINRYRAFEKNTGQVTTPFVMSIHGIIMDKTLEKLEDLITHAVNPKQLRSDIIANSQMELLRSMHKAYQMTAVFRHDDTGVQLMRDSPAAAGREEGGQTRGGENTPSNRRIQGESQPSPSPSQTTSRRKTKGSARTDL